MLLAVKNEGDDNATAYKAQQIRSYDDSFRLEDPSVLGHVKEYAELSTNHIQPIFPQLVIQQIHNTLVARQTAAQGVGRASNWCSTSSATTDDTPEMRALRIKQANLVGPAGYISMEDTEATELVQRATATAGDGDCSILEMSREAPDEVNTLISESMVRRFWVGYARLMGFEASA